MKYVPAYVLWLCLLPEYSDSMLRLCFKNFFYMLDLKNYKKKNWKFLFSVELADHSAQ